MKDVHATYKSSSVDTADQGKLLIITYDFAIKHCKLSLEKFSDKKLIEERTKHLFKVQDALGELISALKLDVGEVAKNLYRLYQYMIRRVVEANMKSDPAPVEEVLKYLEDLRDAWSIACRNIKQQSACDSINLTTGIAVTC